MRTHRFEGSELGLNLSRRGLRSSLMAANSYLRKCYKNNRAEQSNTGQWPC